MKVESQVQANIPVFEPHVITKTKLPGQIPISGNRNDEPNNNELVNKPKTSPENLDVAIKFANETLKMANYHLEFKIYKDTNSYQVSVVDTDSGNVLRKIPPDHMIEFSYHLKEKIDQAVGLMVDEIV